MKVMKKCSNCSNSMDDDALFCSSCGVSVQNPPVKTGDISCCPNCGEKIEDAEARYCPNCGEGLRAGEQALQKPEQPFVTSKVGISPRMVGGMAIAGAAVLVLVFVMFLLGSVFSSSSSKFVTYQREFAKEHVLPTLEDAAKQFNTMGNFSTDMTLTAATIANDSSTISDYLDGSELNLKLETTKRSLLTNFDVKLMGSQILTGAVSYQDGEFGFSVPELADAYYKVDLSKLETKLGSDASGLHEIELPEIPAKVLSAISERYIDVFLSAVNKKNLTISDEKTIHLVELGEDVKGKVYVFKPSQEDLKGMLLKLADQIEKDQKMRGFVSGVIGSNKAILDSYYENGEDFDVFLDRELTNMASDIRNHADDLSQTLADAGFTWTMGVSGKCICMQRIEWDEGNQVLGYESLGKKSDQHDRYYFDAYGERVMLDDQKDQNDGSHHGALSFSEGGYQAFDLQFNDVTPKTKSVLGLPYGTFLFQQSSGDYDNSFFCELNVKKGESGGSDHVLHLNGLSGLSADLPDQLDITLHTTDKKSTAKKPAGKVTDISDYDVSQIESLAYDMAERLQNEVVNNLP